MPAEDEEGHQEDDTSEGGDETDHKAEAEKWKAAAKKHETEWKKWSKEVEAVKRTQLSDTEKATEAAREEGRQAARAELTDKMLRAEIRSAALDKLADPDDAEPLLRNAGLLEDVLDKSGDIDPKAVASAVDRLLKAKPHLAKAGSRPGKLRAGGEQPSKSTSMNDAIRSVLDR